MARNRRRPVPAQRVLVLNWRDTRHPEGGGSERYVESIAARMVAAGRSVTLFCAEHPGHRGRTVRDGITLLHRGGRLSVYPRGLWHVLRHRYDVVVDVQNGVPFWTPLVTRRPVVVLVHHVHREVWPVAVGPLAARVGWFLESQVAPRLYRRCRYVTVSGASRADLERLGVDRSRIEVVPNGTEAWAFDSAPRSRRPRVCVVGRLVPHKQVEHAIEVIARLGPERPVELDVVGHGYWEGELRSYARSRGVADRVRFHGYVDDGRKHEILSAAWIHLCPSLKEGWGLVCVEAARHGVPTVAYRAAGGVRESVLDGSTGILVDDLDALAGATRELLENDVRRQRMGSAARAFAHQFSWDETATRFAAVLDAVGSDAATLPLAVDDERLVDGLRGAVAGLHQPEGGAHGQDRRHQAGDHGTRE